MLGQVKVGLIGAGNMGGALARGLGEPLIVADADPSRAQLLADEIGGTVASSNRELVDGVDVVILAHKPYQLERVAAGLGGDGRFAVVSILGGATVADIEAAYPSHPVYRFMPNIPAEVRQGVLCYAPGSLASDGPEAEILELFGRAGTVIPLPEPMIEPATALMGCAPAFLSLVVEALVDAGVSHGLTAPDATRMAVEGMAGTAAVLREGGGDTLALRRRVTSPGGSTARGLAALEHGGVRPAFASAVDAVVGAKLR